MISSRFLEQGLRKSSEIQKCTNGFRSLLTTRTLLVPLIGVIWHLIVGTQAQLIGQLDSLGIWLWKTGELLYCTEGLPYLGGIKTPKGLGVRVFGS